MENKCKGFHVTIVDNNTGETVRDFDTNAINYVALENTEKGKRSMEEDSRVWHQQFKLS